LAAGSGAADRAVGAGLGSVDLGLARLRARVRAPPRDRIRAIATREGSGNTPSAATALNGPSN
jgi:hypothetical protein